MEKYPIKREDLLRTLVGALQDKDYALAMWEGGASGFNRVDEWSDADVQVIVKDGFVEQAFEDVEDALQNLSQIDYRFRLSEPAWHGHSQCFYRFKDASPYLMLDLVFIQQSSQADRFMKFKIHGQPSICFDKAGLVVEEQLDVDGMIEEIKAAVKAARMRYDLFWILTMKEIHRQNNMEAFAFYYNFAVMPLLEVLRVKHCPVRFFYRTRYPHYDLPKETADRLADFFFVRDLTELEEKFNQAQAWFTDVVEGINWDELRAKLETD